MNMWEILEEGRDDYGRNFGMRSSEVEEAYRAGCRHGYEKAMRELRGNMGFRGEEGYLAGNGYSGGGYIGERRTGDFYPDPYDGMGERRRRRANGQFY